MLPKGVVVLFCLAPLVCSINFVTGVLEINKCVHFEIFELHAWPDVLQHAFSEDYLHILIETSGLSSWSTYRWISASSFGTCICQVGKTDAYKQLCMVLQKQTDYCLPVFVISDGMNEFQ